MRRREALDEQHGVERVENALRDENAYYYSPSARLVHLGYRFHEAERRRREKAEAAPFDKVA